MLSNPYSTLNERQMTWGSLRLCVCLTVPGKSNKKWFVQNGATWYYNYMYR